MAINFTSNISAIEDQLNNMHNTSDFSQVSGSRFVSQTCNVTIELMDASQFFEYRKRQVPAGFVPSAEKSIRGEFAKRTHVKDGVHTYAVVTV